MNEPSPLHRLTAGSTAVLLLIASLSPGALAQEAKPKAPEKTTNAAPAEAPADPPAEGQTKTAKPAADDSKAAAEAETTDANGGEAAAAAGPENEAGAEGTSEGEEAQPAGPTDEERQAARESFEAGMAAFGEGQFNLAAGHFKSAQEAIPSPHAEYWIAKSIDEADPEDENPQATATAYETFLSNPGAKHVGAEQMKEAEQRLAELRKMLPGELVVITDPSGATVTIDGEPVDGTTPVTVQRPAGTYTVVADKEGYDPLSVEVELEGGTILEQQMNLAKTPPPPPEPEVTDADEQEAEPSMIPAYVTLGLGGAGLITGTIFGILALDSKGKFDNTPTRSLADEAERNALIADMSFGIAVTLGVTGVVLLTAKPPTDGGAEAAKRKPKAGQVVVAPYGGPDGGGARAQIKF